MKNIFILFCLLTLVSYGQDTPASFIGIDPTSRKAAPLPDHLRNPFDGDVGLVETGDGDLEQMERKKKLQEALGKLEYHGAIMQGDKPVSISIQGRYFRAGDLLPKDWLDQDSARIQSFNFDTITFLFADRDTYKIKIKLGTHLDNGPTPDDAQSPVPLSVASGASSTATPPSPATDKPSPKP